MNTTRGIDLLRSLSDSCVDNYTMAAKTIPRRSFMINSGTSVIFFFLPNCCGQLMPVIFGVQ